MRGAEAGDGVDDEEGLGVFGLEELGDAFDVVADAGGGFGGLDEDGAGFELEGGFDFVEREGLAVGCFDDVDVAAEGFGEGGPALAELAGGEDEYAVAGRGEVGDGGFHGAGAAAGEDDDVVLGADELLELGEDAGVEGAELGGAVVDVGGGHGELGGGEQGRRARGEEASFADHGFIVASPAGRPLRVGGHLCSVPVGCEAGALHNADVDAYNRDWFDGDEDDDDWREDSDGHCGGDEGEG